MSTLKFTIPCLVDGIDNAVEKAYAGWPDRIYVFDPAGKITYKSGPGPWGFRPREMEVALKKVLGEKDTNFVTPEDKPLSRGADKDAAKLEIKKIDSGGLAIHRVGQDQALLVSNAKPDMRPYIHPIVAPDGKGILTDYSPATHKHQTGLYVGIPKVNGRSYFHNFGGDYFRLKDVKIGGVAGNRATWTISYDWLGADKEPVLTETQHWTFIDHGTHYVLDLEWSARAAVDIKCEKHPYGGLFLRMPWRPEVRGEIVNSEGLTNRTGAEGQRARWVDVGLAIEGREDWGHITILDHSDNPEHPIPWRIDGHMAVGPAPSRLGDWKVAKGETTRAKYRLLVYTGKIDKERIEASWKGFTTK